MAIESGNARSVSASDLGAWPRPPESDNLDWTRLAGTLWRGRWLLLIVMTGVLVVTAAIVQRLPDAFEAEAFVMHDPHSGRLLPDPAGAAPSPESQSELLQIRSRQLAARLVQELDLDGRSEFNPALESAPGHFDRLGVLASNLIPQWRERKATPAPDVVENVFGRINASVVQGTDVIRVSFRASDPVLAADAVNAMLDAYLDGQLQARRSGLAQISGFLGDEIARLGTRLDEAKRAIHRFRRDHGMIGQASLDEQERASLATQLAALRGARIEAEARLRHSDGRDPGAAAGLLPPSPDLHELEARRLDLERQIAEAEQELGPQHPRFAHLRAGLESVERQRRALLLEQSRRLADAVDLGHAQEAALLTDLDRVQQDVERRTQAEVDLQALEREAAAVGAVLETYLGRAAGLESQLRLQAPLSRIISRAAIPPNPVGPPRRLILALALVAALAGGTLLVFLRDGLDDTFRSSEQVEDLLGLPALGLVPLARSRGRRAADAEQLMLERPPSPFSEAMRGLRTAISVTSGGRPARTLLLTSALPGEGKSLTAMSLALTSARARWRTLIIDCDLHRPRLHELARVADGPGLSELLLGQATLAQALLRSDDCGLHLITAGAPVPDPAAVLGSAAMEGLLASAAEAYDLVILDSPPVLSVSDALILAQRVDKTVFLVSWGATRRADVLVGVKQLLEAGARVGGLVLSRVDARKHARYGYRDSGYYHHARYTSYAAA